MEADQPVAVVGLACRFPGADDVEQFWANLVAGRESITFFGPPEPGSAPGGPRDNPDYVAAAPVLAGADLFDAGLFGMTAHEAQVCDPQFRVFLETCHRALEHAGYDPFDMPDSVGVFGSVGPTSYLPRLLRHRPDLAGSSGMLAQTLNQPDYLATLVAYRLNLSGPAMTVLTACSSTLVTVHLACQALVTGDCDAALAGGCVIRNGRGHLWTPGGVLSADGHCRPFDAAASGTIFGSGAGVVVLKRLDDAIADGDHIAAVVLATAVNNDGSQKLSFSAPSVSGQVGVVMEAMTLAGVSPADVGYVEAHATGTALGDPVEVAALGEAYSRLHAGPLPAGSCLLGSVKSNIGHMDEVAGAAGLIKTVLALDREAIPPTINLDTPNPLLELDKTPFQVCTQLRPWQRDPGRPRVAAVTSLGIGGTNAHAVLAEGPPAVYRAPAARPHLLVWSARSPAGEKDLRGSLGRCFATMAPEQFADAAATMQHGRSAHPVRGAVVARSAAYAAAALAAEPGAAAVVTGTVAGDDGPRIAYLLPGQGAQHARMGAGLYGKVRAFTVPMDECIELFEERGLPLYRQWTEFVNESDLTDPNVAQPLLFAVEYALATQLRHWGAGPVAVLGHSIGELTGAAVAGVFTLAQAVRLVAARAAAMAAHPVPGSMLALSAAADDVAELVADPLVVAAVNGARQVVVSGPEPDLAALVSRLADRRIAHRLIPTGAAFHHPAWAEAADAWAEAFEGVEAAPPKIEVFSAAAGGPADAAALADPRFWTGQLMRPVRFHDALGALLATKPDLLVEVGPRATLTSLARRHPDRDATVCVPTLASGRDDHAEVLAAAGRLWVAGAKLDWTALGTLPPRTRVAVPGYPYERIRYWIDPPDQALPAGLAETPLPGSTGIQEARSDSGGAKAIELSSGATQAPRAPTVDPLTSAVTEIAWCEQRRTAAERAEGPPIGAVVLVAPGDQDEVTENVLSAMRHGGLRPTVVRPGDGYAEHDGEFTARPGSLDDLDQVLAALERHGAMPQMLVHAASATSQCPGGTAASRAATWFGSLLALSRLALGSARWPAPPRLLLVTTHSVDVTGAEPIDPGRAALHGLVRTVRAESPRLVCAGMDIDAQVDPLMLAAELTGDRAEVAVVALRGRRRWVPLERTLDLPAATGSALRDEGVYVITGGGGGLGLAVAEHMANTCSRPRLVLLGRRDPGEVVPERIGHLRSLGARVHTFACDVAETAALETVFHEVTQDCGQINGVLHLAGVPGGRMVAFRDPADAATVLAPKTAGTVALETALAGQPLDFVVYFSSRAAADGLVGGGDYAAANAYLDAAAQRPAFGGTDVLSIGWPVWLGAGMASDTGVDIAALNRAVRQASMGTTGPAPQAAGVARPPQTQPPQTQPPPGTPATPGDHPAAPEGTQAETGLAPATSVEAPAAPAPLVWETRLSPATDWVLDDHRVDRMPLLPGTAYLDFTVRAYREAVDGGSQPLEISDMVFRVPMLDQRPRVLQIEFRPDSSGYAVKIGSRPAEHEGPAVIHASGRIRPAQEPPETADVIALRDRFTVSGRPVQTPPGKQLYVIGPRWQNIVQGWQAQEEKLLRIELPAPYLRELPEHALHPALLDTATAGVRGPGQTAAVPIRYRRLVLWRDLPGQFYAHVRPDREASHGTPQGDVDLIADDGTVVARVEGFTMVLADEGQLLAQRTAPTEMPPGPAPQEVTAQPREARPARAEGLDPRLGVELLFRLLGAGMRGHVLVRPFRAGRPVPLRGAGPDGLAPLATRAAAEPSPAVVAAPVMAGASPEVQANSPEHVLTEHPTTSGDLLSRLRTVWMRALGVSEVPPDRDFFDAGGNSLTAVELMAEVRDMFGVELSIGLLLEVRTFAGLAGLLRERGVS